MTTNKTERMVTTEKASYLAALVANLVSLPLGDDFDSGDLWGSTMAIWFRVADMLYLREEEVPDYWEYQRGMSAMSFGDPDDSLSPIQQAVNDDPYLEAYVEMSPGLLRLIGDRAMALSQCLRDMGMDY
jgi:hypothetical protein